MADLPLDKPPKAEGNDALIPFLHSAAGASKLIQERRIAHEKPLPRPKVAFFPMGRSPLKRGMKGLDVLAVKRALSAADYSGFKRNGVYGRGLVEAVERFQKAHRLKVDGQYGQKTHAKLARFYDAYGAFLLAHNATPGPAPKPKPDPLTVIRKRIVGVWFYGYHHRDEMAYLQRRPMIDMGCPPNVPNELDCSTYDTWGYKCGGAPDPNGNGYNGYGFTGTIAAHSRRVSTPKLADHLLYGPAPSYEHVTGDVGGGLCLSMGSTPGPLLLRHHYRAGFAGYFRSLKN